MARIDERRSGGGSGPSAGATAPRFAPPAATAFAILVAAFLLTQYPHALRVPFINDDFVMLDRTRAASFASLWSPNGALFHWYRPWSRELHYWWLQRVAGANELPFHLASLALLVAILALFFAFVRRLAGAAAAVVASAGVLALAAWAVPVLWIAGVQELWMLLFALASLVAFARGRDLVSAAALAFALLSKETAACVPLVLVAYARLVDGTPWSRLPRRLAGHVAVGLAWAMFHPQLGGRLLHGVTPDSEAVAHGAAWVALHTIAMVLNLDGRLAPALDAALVVKALLGAALVAAWVWLGTRVAPPRDDSARRAWRFGLAWAVLGWLPLLMPRLGWHSYYALFGALGAWLALGVLLARQRATATALVAAVALSRAARAGTPSLDWGDEFYLVRAGTFLNALETHLGALHPSFPPHARAFFVAVPNNIGFMTAGAPALRVWYHDPTLAGGFFTDYRRRAVGEPAGEDFFFRFDGRDGWVEIHPGPELAAAHRGDARWQQDQKDVAALYARTEQWGAAARVYEKLAAADTLEVDFPLNAGICYEMAGDSTRAGHWYRRAAARPGAPPDVVELARGYGMKAGH